MKGILSASLALGATLLVSTPASADGVAWRNVDQAHHLAGRKCSAGYLLGKVVLVDRWGAHCPPCRALLPRTQDIWKSFRTKPFVVLGGHCRGWGTADEVASLAKANEITYPIYEDAGLASDEPAFDAIPFLYVVDETGRVIYCGRDERKATEVIVTALTDLESPRNLAQWKRFLDYELDVLPGRAYLRMKAFKKTFPKEVADYATRFAALEKIPDVKKLADLVDVARKGKDARAFDPKKEKAKKAKLVKTLNEARTKYGTLKDSSDARVAQESKNALADIAWTLAELEN